MVGSVKPEDGVEVNETPTLHLGDFEVVDTSELVELLASDTSL